ncbi:MAG: hypothetical protein K9M17_02830 [Mariprofundaceae bacterium]|nr:hypothetical protein [Mariprofundaceae bacterium]
MSNHVMKVANISILPSPGLKQAGSLLPLFALLSALLFVPLLGGCSVKAPATTQAGLDGPERRQAEKLGMLLVGLNEAVNAGEARLLARDSISYAYSLSQRYDLVWPPLLHNTLVNIGLKERGLCHQWADDMLAHMRKAEYQSFDFYLGVSKMGTFREHNTLVVSAKGAGFDHGVVLDPWRDSGTLFFAKINDDHEYTWGQREASKSDK